MGSKNPSVTLLLGLETNRHAGEGVLDEGQEIPPRNSSGKQHWADSDF